MTVWKDTLLPGISRKTDDLLRPQSKVHQVYTVDQKIQKRNGFTTSYVATINIRYQCHPHHPHQHHHPSSMISMTRNVPPPEISIVQGFMGVVFHVPSYIVQQLSQLNNQILVFGAKQFACLFIDLFSAHGIGF